MQEIREIKFKKDAQKGFLEGARKVFQAVSSTMGAKGRYVAVQNRYDQNYTTKDGHYTAQTIYLEDEAENMGAQMIKEVAAKSADKAGDGTTTATVLAYHLYRLASEAISNGAHAIDVKRGIIKAVEKTVELIKKKSKPVKKDLKILHQVATVSANNDSSIGDLIVQAYKKIKPEGIVKVGEAKGVESNIETTSGMRINAGYLSPYFINNAERMVVDLKKAYICLYDGNISTFKEIENLMEFMAEHPENSLLLIAMGVEQEALQTLVLNKTKGGFKVCAVPAPGVGKTRDTYLKDIEAVTGATIISDREGKSMKDFTENHLGSAKSIRITERDCEIIDGGFDKDTLKERITTIKNAIEKEKQPQSIEFHKNRLALIDGGVAVIHVGATTAVELKEKKDLVEDAIAATKSAMEEGVVPGGGSALYHISKMLKADEKFVGLNDGEQKGIDVALEAMKEPFKVIMGNAGLDVEEMVKVMDVNMTEFNQGYNLNTDEYCDMMKAGILDTAKIERMAIENSSSVANMMFMTDTLIYTKNPK
jgi:chaperonin GroEL